MANLLNSLSHSSTFTKRLDKTSQVNVGHHGTWRKKWGRLTGSDPTHRYAAFPFFFFFTSDPPPPFHPYTPPPSDFKSCHLKVQRAPLRPPPPSQQEERGRSLGMPPRTSWTKPPEEAAPMAREKRKHRRRQLASNKGLLFLLMCMRVSIPKQVVFTQWRLWPNCGASVFYFFLFPTVSYWNGCFLSVFMRQ